MVTVDVSIRWCGSNRPHSERNPTPRLLPLLLGIEQIPHSSANKPLTTNPMPWSVRKRSIQTLCRRYLQTAAKNDRPLRLAVIGAGPAGFYTAYRVLSKLQNSKVDMYESLPVPYGLVRFGVAPDHPEVKVWPSHLPLHNPECLTEDLNLELSRQIQ